MDIRTRFGSLLVLLLGSMHCGSTVSPFESDSATLVDAASRADAPPIDPRPTASCREVTASCGPSPALVVHGHATGLSGLDGAVAAFAVRYVRTTGEGLDVPHGVALGRTIVRDGGFDTCVCVPTGANVYPEIVAVVFRPGATTETAGDVARAEYSLRYATLGDEDVSSMITEAPTPVLAEAAVAALDPRVSRVALHAIDSANEGHAAWAGLVANERPLAAEVARSVVTAGAASFTWIRPGRAWPTERLVMVVDRNNDQHCTTADVGAVVPLTSRDTVDAAGVTWVSGEQVQSLCNALLVQFERSH